MPVSWGFITAEDVAAAVGAESLAGRGGVPISGAATDTRTLKRGEMFFALRGERFDGHDFVAEAVRRGAAAVVCDMDRASEWSGNAEQAFIGVPDTLKALGDMASWWRRNHRAEVTALTGSSGKTSTKEMAAGVLELEGPTLKSQGNFNNLIGLPLTLLGLGEEHRYAVLEMGMNRPGEIGRLTEIADPRLGLITNVSRAHLEVLGDIRAVARAKGELLERMSPRGIAVLNGDDPLLMAEAPRFTGNVITFGFGPHNDFRAEGVRREGGVGTGFTLVSGGERTDIRLSVPGRQNVWNALAASALAVTCGASLENVVLGLGAFRGVPGRFSVTDLPGGGRLVDDTYNANPASLKTALESLEALAAGGGRIILCLGDMLELGREAVPAHLEAGRMAARTGVEYMLVMGEHAGHVIQGAAEAGFPRRRAILVADHSEMADRLLEVLGEGDHVLLKASRGMHFERVLERLERNMEKGGLHGGRTGGDPSNEKKGGGLNHAL
jgi:UDP-N-acetylmuramoyl-tripeptide--D-alanyl-D-alanine ligase